MKNHRLTAALLVVVWLAGACAATRMGRQAMGPDRSSVLTNAEGEQLVHACFGELSLSPSWQVRVMTATVAKPLRVQLVSDVVQVDGGNRRFASRSLRDGPSRLLGMRNSLAAILTRSSAGRVVLVPRDLPPRQAESPRGSDEFDHFSSNPRLESPRVAADVIIGVGYSIEVPRSEGPERRVTHRAHLTLIDVKTGGSLEFQATLPKSFHPGLFGQ